MPKPWTCEGIAKNGQEHDNQTLKGKHEPYENFGDDCVLCNLTRDQVVSDTSASILPVKKLALGTSALLFLGAVGWFTVKPCPDGKSKTFGVVCQEAPASPEPPQPDPTELPNPDPSIDARYNWEPERFTWGQQTLFPGVGNQLRDQGIEAFNQGNYSEASQLFKRAIEGNRNDPEPLIFYNNALAQQQGEPLTLAVVVPVDSRENSAKEMLRGVAQAQDEFNEEGGVDGRLVEIVVANDGNDPEIASKVARALSDDPTILGVIGHNSSNASKAGLEIYEQAGLPMISPTSTSTELEGDLFFRTVPSDAAAAEKLASYANDSLEISKAVVFYNPESSFSTSLKEAFEARFTDLGGEAVARDMTDSNLNAGIEVATSISKENAEAILLFPNTDYTSVAIELARANAQLEDDQLRLLAGDSLYSIDTLTGGGESVEGLVLAIPWFAASPDAADFAASGQKQWGGDVNWRTAMSYDAAQSFLAALSENVSRDSILANLKTVTLSESETSGEVLQFTEEGERQSEPLLVEVRRGENNPPESEFGYNLID